MLDLAYCIILILFFVVVLSCLWQEKRARISPTPVLPWVRRRALALLKDHPPDQEVLNVCDLGCGWGGVLTALAKRYPRARVAGYETSFWPYVFSAAHAAFSGGRIVISRADFFAADLSTFDVVFCYLSPYHMGALKPKLSTLKPGSVVVSCSFAIPGWKCAAMETVKGLVDIPVFLYRIKPAPAS